jgi:RNA polymerase sigma factor (sigma-70 family)
MAAAGQADRGEVEAEIRRRFDAGDLDAAITAALDAYGGELFGFLVGLTGDRDRAGDVFGALCERMWRGLPRFRWGSSFRVWAYTIARNEFLRAATGGARADRRVRLSQVPSLQAAVSRVRSATPLYQRSEVKDQLARVRTELSPDDHILLGLRLDRGLGWNEIALVLGSPEDDIARDAAALRKRYERLKGKLKKLLSSTE